MAVRFVSVDHDTPMLLPPDLRDWVPADHIVHFVMDAVALLDLGSAKINHGGTGSAQYPPSMMLGLLIYSYATGTFSSRKIEKLTYENVAVRFLSGDTHPDHDTICTFRRENKELMESAFHRILHCAALTQVLKVGGITVAIDGTKILASASKHGAVSHGHALEQMKLLEDQIAELLAKAEDADSAPLQDGLSIPAEIARREERIGKLKQATTVIEARAAERCREKRQPISKKHGRTIAELEVREDPPAPPEGAEIAEVMAWRTSTTAGKELYGLRKQTVEPVFGIIKEALGFRRFHLRGLTKVNLEWTLVRLAYNIKRLYHTGATLKTATA